MADTQRTWPWAHRQLGGRLPLVLVLAEVGTKVKEIWVATAARLAAANLRGPAGNVAKRCEKGSVAGVGETRPGPTRPLIDAVLVSCGSAMEHHLATMERTRSRPAGQTDPSRVIRRRPRSVLVNSDRGFGAWSVADCARSELTIDGGVTLGGPEVHAVMLRLSTVRTHTAQDSCITQARSLHSARCRRDGRQGVSRSNWGPIDGCAARANAGIALAAERGAEAAWQRSMHRCLGRLRNQFPDCHIRPCAGIQRPRGHRDLRSRQTCRAGCPGGG